MSQADLARHIWGDDIRGDTLLARKRTIRLWENAGRTPSPMAQRSLKQLVDGSHGSNDDSGTSGSSPSEGNANDAGPRRVTVGGLLPSMGD